MKTNNSRAAQLLVQEYPTKPRPWKIILAENGNRMGRCGRLDCRGEFEIAIGEWSVACPRCLYNNDPFNASYRYFKAHCHEQ